ncbi:isochorismatase family protein [Pseudoalteromonas luteoviolacea]|uniref:Hydrolase n=1 Tax=Pseudoalteromonas luteoviolacea S4054 TaxID=1129367 RepID=A0A0F6A9L0_9GAMM|nr:isochorismatase family protein [Pseudoalteromonas luteoviolacea]AOT10817.1 hydrolase [Pseudoalteromonas luteoviolacea]AOT16021.1 hydrolase [Pseudoalteromonas luteoviolacea]AOT20638.1 hydrolase [Pseudoalteromonas luteoviolacea]KKE82860.1 hydrolase [Pseudoalteromonas luteoviolacea S4054]KZN75259.1 hydrolase [Pseudoalteromonas luteoviolacea S4047-1]
MSKALIIIDTQNSFFKTDYWQEKDFFDFKTSLGSLIYYFNRADLPIIKVLHSREDATDSPFNPDSGLVEPMDFLPTSFTKVFYKSVHNAFTDTGLATWLKRNHIDTVVITGIRTEQCCETTARIAFDLGFNVEFVTDATLTFDMTCPVTGVDYASDEIKARTELVLANRFASIHSHKDY